MSTSTPHYDDNPTTIWPEITTLLLHQKSSLRGAVSQGDELCMNEFDGVLQHWRISSVIVRTRARRKKVAAGCHLSLA